MAAPVREVFGLACVRYAARSIYSVAACRRSMRAAETKKGGAAANPLPDSGV
jgi:hypothetical protein